MKLKYFIVSLLLLAFSISLVGCTPVWTYDFVKEESLIRGKEAWRPEYTNFSFNQGLILVAERIAGPHFYNGDFTVTVEFDLHTSLTDLAYFEFNLGSHSDFYDSVWLGGLVFNNVGSPTSSLKLFHDTTSTGYEDIYYTLAADLVYEEGGNTMMIEKIGDLLWITVNGTKITTSVQITDYSGGIFCPYLACWSDKVIFKKVIIEYEGDKVLID